MVVKDEASTFDIVELGRDESSGLLETTDHALAWFTRASRRARIIYKHPARTYKRKLVGRLSPLSIEFDVSQNQTSNADDKNHTEETGTEIPSEVDIEDEIKPRHLLTWSKEDRNDLLGAFFLGYLFSQIPAARGAELFGAKM